MRIEKDKELKRELENTKKELSEQIKKDTRRGHPLLTCLIIVLVLILAILGFVGFVVARTGLVEVPVFSLVFYEPPEPARLVTEESLPVEEMLEQTISKILTERLIASGGADFDRNLSVDITEAALTATLKQTLEENQRFFTPVGAQVAIIDSTDTFEIFLPLANNEMQSALVASIAPTLDEGGMVEAKITDFYVGQLRIPNWFVNLSLQKPLVLAANELNRTIGRYAVLQKLDIHSGFATLTGTISAEILEISN